MKKFLNSVVLAFAFAAAAPIPVAAQDAADLPPTPAQQADDLCTKMAEDKDIAVTCTSEQKFLLTALMARIAAMPVTDRYSEMAQQYEFIEGFRQIFFPNEAPIPAPPKDKFEEAAMRSCMNKEKMTKTGCTPQQQAQLTDFLRRLDARAEPTTIEEVQQREQFIRDEVTKIFSEPLPPAQQQPAQPVQPAQQKAPAARPANVHLRRLITG